MIRRATMDGLGLVPVVGAGVPAAILQAAAGTAISRCAL